MSLLFISFIIVWSCPCRMHLILIIQIPVLDRVAIVEWNRLIKGVAYCDKGQVRIANDMKGLSSIPYLVGLLRNLTLILISCCLSLSALDTTQFISPYLVSYTNSYIKESSRLDQHHHRHGPIANDIRDNQVEY